jgi:hypothetical protein
LRHKRGRTFVINAELTPWREVSLVRTLVEAASDIAENNNNNNQLQGK